MQHEGQIDPDNPKPSHLENPTWLRQFGLLKDFGLTFHLQVYYQQMPDAESLLKLHSDVQFVLCHTGQPARRDQEGIEGCKKGMKNLAAYDNLVVKISGWGCFIEPGPLKAYAHLLNFLSKHSDRTAVSLEAISL